jgi:protein phosphatase
MIEAGVPDPDPAERHVLTKFIGLDNRRPLTPNFAVSVKLEEGDRIILCSDGITGVLSDEQIAETLSQPQLPEVVGRALVQQALDAGSRDNVTMVLAEVVALDEETLPEEMPQPPAAPEGETTKEFGVVTPAQILQREQEVQREQKRERRRELSMIIAVILAVLAISVGIIYLALRRSIHKENLLATPGIVCVTKDVAPDMPGQLTKENAYVRS